MMKVVFECESAEHFLLFSVISVCVCTKPVCVHSVKRQYRDRVLQNLDQWSLRVSYLELKLLLEQASTQAVS